MKHLTHRVEKLWALFLADSPVFDRQLIQVYTLPSRSFLGSVGGDAMVDDGGQYDLSHEVFYQPNGYSLISLTSGMDCKNAVYTAPRGEKAAISGGGIGCKNAAE